MNVFALWLAHRLARTLDPQERDALLGDQKELGQSGGRAAREALGLVVRRQYQLSTADESGIGAWWRLIPIFAILLSHSVKISRWLDAAYFPDNLLLYSCWGTIVAVLSWTTGFLLGSFSGRARRVNSALLTAFWLAYLSYLSARYELSTAALTLHGLLFVLPVVTGFRSGVIRKSLSTFKSVIIAALPPLILLSLVILITRGEASGGSPLTWIALVLFLVFTFIMVAMPGAGLVILSRMPRRSEPSPHADEAAP